MARTFVIGDIHGALRALQQLVERVAPRPGDRLIFLGDYVDGWSESRQVIEYILELAARHDCVFIRGNHDVWCEEWLEGWGASADWLQHGGAATMLSYKGITAPELDRHLQFFDGLRSYVEEEGLLFVHAGFCSVHGPSAEHFESNFWWDRTLWETALATDDRLPPDSPYYPQRLQLYKEIFIGHTPTTNYGVDLPMHCCNVWDMDSGAAFTGKLSAMDIDTKRITQSDTVKTLYPGETGRNK
ncbi:MAG TPA: metallophosphoesterase family protein [Puia sp.]|nr:metallophosphoesterase family protein [Puia sp.]